MPRNLRRMIGPIVTLVVVLGGITLFLGIEMSSPYTRASPDCSVWCVLREQVSEFVGLGGSAD